MQDASRIPEEELASLGARHPNLYLLLLFGSRAGTDARDQSDWDLGYLSARGLDHDALLLDVVSVLGTDRVDLVDLGRAGALVRFRAARDGRVLYESQPATFGKFWIEAVDFWCEVEPILKVGYSEGLSRLRR